MAGTRLILAATLLSACAPGGNPKPATPPMPPTSRIIPMAGGFAIESAAAAPTTGDRLLIPVGAAIRLDRTLLEGSRVTPQAPRP